MDPNKNCNHFLIRYFVHIYTRKLQVVCGLSTHQMNALQSEISIYCVIAEWEIRMWSCGFNNASQSLFDKLFVHFYMHNFKTMGHAWMLRISNDCSPIRNICCVVYGCMRDGTGELWPQTSISDAKYVCVYYKRIRTSLFGAQLHMTTTLTQGRI